MDAESYCQEQLLNWMVNSTRENRGEFLRRYLDLLPQDELQTVSYLVATAKKRPKRRERSRATEPVPKTLKVFEPAPVQAPWKKGWWTQWKPSEVLAMDVEKIAKPLQSIKSKPKFFQAAAEVSVVNNKCEVIYKQKILHPAGSFRVNPYAKNGYKKDSLLHGKPLKQVQDELTELFDGKLIVLLNGEGDFNSLDIPIACFNVFDLQSHWYRRDFSPRGREIIEGLGLRSLCKHFFKIDMQPENIPHSSDVDASWTMSLFMDVYVKTKTTDMDSKLNIYESNHITHFNRLYLTEK